jgi:hypothetical protein
VQYNASKTAGAGCQIHTRAAADALPIQDNVTWRPVKPTADTENYDCHLLNARLCTNSCMTTTLLSVSRNAPLQEAGVSCLQVGDASCYRRLPCAAAVAAVIIPHHGAPQLL